MERRTSVHTYARLSFPAGAATVVCASYNLARCRPRRAAAPPLLRARHRSSLPGPLRGKKTKTARGSSARNRVVLLLANTVIENATALATPRHLLRFRPSGHGAASGRSTLHAGASV